MLLPYLEQALTIVEKEYDRSDKRFEKTTALFLQNWPFFMMKSQKQKRRNMSGKF